MTISLKHLRIPLDNQKQLLHVEHPWVNGTKDCSTYNRSHMTKMTAASIYGENKNIIVSSFESNEKH